MDGDLPPDPSAEALRPIYDVPFVWESSHGHVVELLVDHAAPGLVVDIGCGYAPHAEPLVERGFGYVGIDADTAAVDRLRARGFVAAVADANDPDALVAALDSVTSGLDSDTISAVLALDVLEHLVSPHRSLAAVTGWMRPRSIPLLGVSLPNASHQDVALKLLLGRFEMTPSGLLDHTHLRFFTDRSVTSMLGRAGMVERARNDVTSPKTDQDWPAVHPMLSDGALLGSYLRRVRALGDDHGDTFQFVRLFAPDPDATLDPTLLASRPADPEASVAVVVAPECDDEDAARLVERLDAQRTVVVRLGDGMSIADALAGVASSYTTVMRGGERVAPDWAQRILDAADHHPGAVVRSGPMPLDALDIDDDDGDGDGTTDVSWASGFALFDHYLADATPGAAIAFPTSFLRDVSTIAAESAPSIDTHALLMEAAPICGVVETGTGTVAVRPGWQRPLDSVEATLDRLSDAPLLAPYGAAREIAGLLRRLREAHAELVALEADAQVLRRNVEQLEGELDRPEVRAARRVTGLLGRIRRR